jgi:hypothetical protein
MSGPGDKRIGSSNQGKPIVGRGTSAADATLKADGRTYMTDIAVDNVNTIFVVAGAGTGGLRVEAPMNANYSSAVPTSDSSGSIPIRRQRRRQHLHDYEPARYAGIATEGQRKELTVRQSHAVAC